MKSYTDISQSKKLVEILPLESADMCLNMSQLTNISPLMTPYCKFKEFFNIEETPDFLIPCWSLAALLDFLKPNVILKHEEYVGWKILKYIIKENQNSILSNIKCVQALSEDNPIDACVEMIVKLKESKLL